jgi:hypothetical protein
LNVVCRVRLPQELVVNHPDDFNVKTFVPQLTRLLQATDPYARQFLLGWISLLQNTPGITLLPDLPVFFPGLYAILAETEMDIRNKASSFFPGASSPV